MHPSELEPELLATTDKSGGRVFLHPAEVRGRWRRRRNWVQAILLLILLLLPWVRLAGQPLILLDIPGRRFHFFGLLLLAHEAPLLFYFLAGFAFLLVLVTSIWGRVWCGWACPQTVFIEAAFRRIERWIEGSHLQRRRLDAAPMSPGKFLKRAAKWTGYILLSGLIAHSVLAYFTGAEQLLEMMSGDPHDNWGYFVVASSLTGVLAFNFGWFREQFCIIMCPYGRLLSSVMDRNTTTIVYDVARGEPRRGSAGTLASTSVGDCVNCYRCVQVCPTGVDIRRGVQLECINCTACVDVCDEVMTRLKRPSGLIRYGTLAELSGQTTRRWRPRVVAYAVFVAALAVGLIWQLTTRSPVEILFLRARGAPYVRVDDGSGDIQNQFTLELANQAGLDAEVHFAVVPEAEMAGAELILPMNPLILKAGAQSRLGVFAKIPLARFRSGQARLKVRIDVRESGSSRLLHVEEREVPVVGPYS